MPNPTTPAKLLVTGCAGFIGSHLTERLLQDGHRVIGVDNFDSFYGRSIKERNLALTRQHPNFSFIEADIESTDWFAQLSADVDTVVHLAAKTGVQPSIGQPASYVAANIVGTQNLLEWMRTRGVGKLIFASSSSVYGNNETVPFGETDRVDGPISPYAFTKRAGELLNHTYHHLYGMGVVNLRFFTVYGERQRPDLAIHKFVQLITAGEPVTIYGAGNTSRDYTYIADTVDGIIRALAYIQQHPNVYEIVNLGNQNPVTLQTLVETIYRIMDKPLQVVHLPKQPGDVERTVADMDKSFRLLGYQPRVSLEDGLRRFVDWYKTANHD